MSEQPEQFKLFDVPQDWEREWKGMPEFVQKDLRPYKTICVHFENLEDIKAFAKLVEQTVTLDTKSIWYPEAEVGHYMDKRYVDVAPNEDSTEEGIETTTL